jgi:hypothetical protein
MIWTVLIVFSFALIVFLFSFLAKLEDKDMGAGYSTEKKFGKTETKEKQAPDTENREPAYISKR